MKNLLRGLLDAYDSIGHVASYGDTPFKEHILITRIRNNSHDLTEQNIVDFMKVRSNSSDLLAYFIETNSTRGIDAYFALLNHLPNQQAQDVLHTFMNPLVLYRGFSPYRYRFTSFQYAVDKLLLLPSDIFSNAQKSSLITSQITSHFHILVVDGGLHAGCLNFLTHLSSEEKRAMLAESRKQVNGNGTCHVSFLSQVLFYYLNQRKYTAAAPSDLLITVLNFMREANDDELNYQLMEEATTLYNGHLVNNHRMWSRAFSAQFQDNCEVRMQFYKMGLTANAYYYQQQALHSPTEYYKTMATTLLQLREDLENDTLSSKQKAQCCKQVISTLSAQWDVDNIMRNIVLVLATGFLALAALAAKNVVRYVEGKQLRLFQLSQAPLTISRVIVEDLDANGFEPKAAIAY